MVWVRTQSRCAMILSAQTAIALIDNIRNDFTSDLDKTILAATAHRLYDKAVRIAANQYAKTHDPQALNKAFDAAERSHARIVLDGLLAVQAERQLPERNRIRLSQLKAEVNKLSKRLWETPINDPSVSMLRNELATVQDRLQIVLSDLDKQNTAFAQRKSPAKPPVTLDNIRSTLDDATTTMVSYFLSEKTIYAFVISRNGSELLPLPRPKNLNGMIENLRLTLDSAANSSNIAPFAVRYADLAVKLYNDLLRSPLTHLATPPHRLIIIPDGTLAYIPFDALLAQKPAKSKDFRSLPYIVRDYAISYAASATLRDAQIRLPRSAPRAEKLFVGYGTSFSKTAVLADVHLSPTEQAALHSSANAVTEDDLPNAKPSAKSPNY